MGKQVAISDTFYGITAVEYLRVAEMEGFEVVLHLPFRAAPEGISESLYVLYLRRDGILLKFDTYGGSAVNGGTYCYNWLPPDVKRCNRFTSTGFFHKCELGMVWAGSHDCRDTMRFHIRRLRNNGEFVPRWVKRPLMFSLTHYADAQGVDGITERMAIRNRVHADRFAMLPKSVRSRLCSEEHNHVPTP